MKNNDFGYFGSGLSGYAHYTTSMNRNRAAGLFGPASRVSGAEAFKTGAPKSSSLPKATTKKTEKGKL